MRRLWLRVLEIVLWATAVVLLGSYAWVYLDRNVYQAYQDWAFDRKLDHQSATVPGFILHSLRLGRDEPAHTNPDQLAGFGPAEPNSGTPAQPKPPAAPSLPEQAVVGRIEIPRIGVRAMILEGTSDSSLRRAVGHIEGTALPGDSGNVGLAGHRDTFFLGLKSIREGDKIRLRTLDGTFTYKVEAIRIVTPHDVDVLDPTPDPTLTLVTCYPFNYVGSAPDRYIVKARKVGDSPAS